MPKIHYTKKFKRMRVKDPKKFDSRSLRTKELIEKGFKVLRLWENEIVLMNLNDFKIKLEV